MKTQKKKLKTKKINKKNSSKQKCQNAYQLKILPLSIYLSRSLCSAEHHICICKTNWWAGAGQNHKRTVRITHWLSLSHAHITPLSLSLSTTISLSLSVCHSLSVSISVCPKRKLDEEMNVKCLFTEHRVQHSHKLKSQDTHTKTATPKHRKKSNRNCRSCVA